MSEGESDSAFRTEPSRPIHEMTPAERLAESLERIVALHRHFEKLGAKVKLEDTTLIVETAANNYFVDFDDRDPRFLKMQSAYVIETGDYARAALVCSLATERSFGAKAIARPEGNGYRLFFSVEVIAVDLPAFTGAIGLYQALIEDCREAYLKIAAASSN